MLYLAYKVYDHEFPLVTRTITEFVETLRRLRHKVFLLYGHMAIIFIDSQN